MFRAALDRFGICTAIFTLVEDLISLQGKWPQWIRPLKTRWFSRLLRPLMNLPDPAYFNRVDGLVVKFSVAIQQRRGAGGSIPPRRMSFWILSGRPPPLSIFCLVKEQLITQLRADFGPFFCRIFK
ncbi:uncharacterized protein CLUP02_05770 [Colletotrichum lupini]|uniref:Uncharacterized protein n=1 Tax=Colletotrichum lupini TaxID=145971 RepID=A0A9Q8WEX7_9PEZI|nr:uncharacterized protein CLUP02_05770 [Colletotrichum lupini]UQC80287.1 hypothetical protein CLUP02_05770 [Colletotrichum lupini]